MTLKKSVTKASITTPEQVYELFRRVLATECRVDRDKEHFWSIGLTTRNSVKYIELVSLGTLNAALVHPREVFRFAIMQGGVSTIMVAHNHPSGNPEPSEDDIRLTKRLVECGRLLGIEVLDSFIIADGYLSFKERGII